jgi:hypothetical protein
MHFSTAVVVTTVAFTIAPYDTSYALTTAGSSAASTYEAVNPGPLTLMSYDPEPLTLMTWHWISARKNNKKQSWKSGP